MTPFYELADNAQVLVFDTNRFAWQETADPGLWLKPVRQDDDRGLFLGLIRFDPFVPSGVHQHQGVATSFVVAGGLTDHHGPVRLHQVGINVKGSTHTAISYETTVLASRLEGPVIYLPQTAISGIHAGSHHQSFRNPDPDVPPEVNIDVDDLPAAATGVPGVKRQMIFDYAGTGSDHRMVQLQVRPETEFEFEATALTEFWVRGGAITVNGTEAPSNAFVVCEPRSRVRMVAPFGALLLGWAEGREKSAGDLFGFATV